MIDIFKSIFKALAAYIANGFEGWVIYTVTLLILGLIFYWIWEICNFKWVVKSLLKYIYDTYKLPSRVRELSKKRKKP